MFSPRRSLLVFAVLIVLETIGIVCHAQEPDKRGEVTTDAPTYQGVTAHAPIPPELHVKNEGGSDGSGLCVISSILLNGMYQGVPGLNVPNAKGEAGKGSELWKAAKAAPGGYYDTKLEKLIDKIMPADEHWSSYSGTETATLDTLSSMGYAIGATMNTGALYSYQPIHHMISLTHYSESDGWACVVDNNAPRKYSWMPAKEFARRWIDGGQGWAWIWTRLPPESHKSRGAVVLILGAAAAILILPSGRDD